MPVQAAGAIRPTFMPRFSGRGVALNNLLLVNLTISDVWTDHIATGDALSNENN
jgi:hypothetical protein